MKINSARLEALLLEMLADVKRGPYSDVTMCILEREGAQVQVTVTSDQHSFMGALTTGVIDAAEANAPGFEQFVEQLKAAGVTIEGEAKLRDMVAAAEDWTAAVAQLVETGRREGIRFTRARADSPSREQLDAIVRGYRFDGPARSGFLAMPCQSGISVRQRRAKGCFGARISLTLRCNSTSSPAQSLI